MARTDTLGHFLTDIADAIREAEGSSAEISASDFDTRIRALGGGGGSSLRNIQVGDILYGKHLYYEFSNEDFSSLSDNSGIVVTQPNPNRYNATSSIDYMGGEWSSLSIATNNGDIDRLYSSFAEYQESPYEVIGEDWQMPVASIQSNDPIFLKLFVDANEMES